MKIAVFSEETACARGAPPSMKMYFQKIRYGIPYSFAFQVSAEVEKESMVIAGKAVPFAALVPGV